MALASAWAGVIASLDRLTHGNSGARIAEVYPDRPSGEVIGAGQQSAAQVTSDWMTSPGHAKQILAPTT